MKKFLCVLACMILCSGVHAGTISEEPDSTLESDLWSIALRDSVESDSGSLSDIFLAKLGSAYVIREDCPEETTAGMVNWAYSQAEKFDRQTAVLNRKILSPDMGAKILGRGEKGRLNKLHQALLLENTVWKALLHALRTFDSIAMDIYIIENGTGSIDAVINSLAYEELSYIRMACLKEDVVTLTTPTGEAEKKDEGMPVDSLYYYMMLCRPYVTVDMINDSDQDFDVSDLKRLNDSHPVPLMKQRIEAWVRSRRKVSDLLNGAAKSQYDSHTEKVLRSLIYHYWNSWS